MLTVPPETAPKTYPETMFLPVSWASLSPVKLTQKIHHHQLDLASTWNFDHPLFLSLWFFFFQVLDFHFYALVSWNLYPLNMGNLWNLYNAVFQGNSPYNVEIVARITHAVNLICWHYETAFGTSGVEGWNRSPKKMCSSPNSGSCEHDLIWNKVFVNVIKMKSH